MGITHVDKILSEERIDCDGILNVTLSVTAQPDVVNNPVDIALVLDRSGSMAGTPMMHLKAGAKEFIDIVMKRTGGRMGRLANGNRIGIVSFAHRPERGNAAQLGQRTCGRTRHYHPK